MTARAYRKLWSRVLTKNPAAEAPVNIKNFLSFPFTLPFIVKNISAAPNKEKIRNGDRKRREPSINSPTAGTKNILTITKKTPIRA